MGDSRVPALRIAGGRPSARTAACLVVFSALTALLLLVDRPAESTSDIIAAYRQTVSYITTSSVSVPGPRCPSPWEPALPVDAPLPLGQAECYDIPSSSPDFDLQICPQPTACNSFTVRILRTDAAACERMESRVESISDDPEVVSWMRDSVGPDAFLLRTSGGQRWASELGVYDGECAYHFDVALSNGGPVWLELWHTFSDYLSFDEKFEGRVPPKVMTPLLREPLELRLCPAECPVYHAGRLNGSDDASTAFSMPGMFTPPSLTFAPDGLPRCGGQADLVGLYLPWHPMDVAAPPAPVLASRNGSTPLMGQYQFVPTECDLRHSGNQFLEDHSGCTDKPTRTLWVGDSHMRFLLHSWQYRLDGHTDFYPEKQKNVMGFSEATYGNSSHVFFWAPWVGDPKQVPADTYESLDAVIYSHLSWPAMIGTDTQKAMRELDQTFAIINEKGTNLKRKIFMTPAPYPVSWEVDRKEHRTNVRLAYWVMKATELARARGWMVLDQFNIGMPLQIEMLASDGLHLAPSDVHATLLDEVLAKAGIC